MASSVPYEGTLNGFKYQWICTRDRLYNDYIITSPDGRSIRVNDLTPSIAYKMAQDPKAYYEKCISENSTA